MHCITCGETATAACRFCGRAVCTSHIKTGRFVSGWRSTGQPGWGRFPTTSADIVIVPDAVWCGTCTVQPVQQ